MTFKFLFGEFVHLSSLFELLYYFRSLRHQPLHEMFLALSTNTNSKYSGGTKYKYTLFRGPSTKYKYAFFRGSEHQIQIHIFQGVQHQIQVHIIQGVRAPNKNTHYSGDPSTRLEVVPSPWSSTWSTSTQNTARLVRTKQSSTSSCHFNISSL